MTLDQLIAQLEVVRKEHGGHTPVMLYDGHVGEWYCPAQARVDGFYLGPDSARKVGDTTPQWRKRNPGYKKVKAVYLDGEG